MDCGWDVLIGVGPARKAAASLLAILSAACSSGPGAASDAPRASDIRELRWLAPGADRVKALTMRPGVCMRARAPDEDLLIFGGGENITDAQIVETGRLVFESPALLGGAAARMGLSCSSCHRNGRGNPDFFIEGISDEPGTADVTSSLVSRVRGDGRFNPVPIPDLAARDGGQMQDRRSEAFRAKVRGLVVEEFDGQAPPRRVFEALLVYLDRIDAAGPCGPGARISASGDLTDAISALDLADAYRRAGASEEALLMARVSREQLGRLHERFVAPDRRDVREALVSASLAIGDWMQAMRSGTAGPVPRADLLALKSPVDRHHGRSLYDPDVLEKALE